MTHFTTNLLSFTDLKPDVCVYKAAFILNKNSKLKWLRIQNLSCFIQMEIKELHNKDSM